MSVSTPLLFSSSGPVPTPPSTLLAALLAYVAGQAPGYTANLPGSLIEDVSSTDLGALIVVDQARVDAVNNVSPYSANAFVLNQQGVMLGLPSGLSSNANALVVFSGTPGYVIPPGFQVGDGTYTYNVQDGGTIGNSGQSQSLYVVCTSSNVFPIPANSITTIITSVPSPYSLTVTNPVAGNAATGAETTQAYRSRIMTAFNGIIQGVNSQIKTLVMSVPGVSSRLVAVRQNGIYWTVVCGGGDPFQVAGAIYAGCSQIGLLTGSSISSARNVTVSIYDAPDNYTIVFVNPPQQVVTVGVTWNTTLANFTAVQAVNQYIINAVQSYVNSIIVGQGINLLEMTAQIQTAVSPVLDPNNLTTLQFAVTVNGVLTPPSAGTSVIPSDPESYFYVSPSGVTSTQG